MQIQHLTDYYRASRCDSVWVKNLASEGGWIAISHDQGHDKTRPKLPVLCREYGLTCILMSSALHQQGVKMHMEVIHEVLRNAEAIYKAPPGSVIKLCQTQERGGIVKFMFRVTRKDGPPVSLGVFLDGLISPKSPPQSLFKDINLD